MSYSELLVYPIILTGQEKEVLEYALRLCIDSGMGDEDFLEELHLKIASIYPEMKK